MTHRVVTLPLLVACAACTPVSDARTTFETRALPVFQQRCAAPICHGVAPGAEASGERIDWSLFFLKLNASGRIASPEQARTAALRVVNTAEDPAFSTLLRKPLPVSDGGLPHLGGENFSGEEDPAWQAVRDWILTENEGGEDPLPFNTRERLFAETVEPALVEATCLTARCHGLEAGATPFHLDPGYRGRFPAAATRHNYAEALAVVTLDGHPGQSRLLRKALPIGPGIVHKGLNFDFFQGNPSGGRATIEAWICAERRARTGQDCTAPSAPEAALDLVYVGGPLSMADAFDLDTFTPGTDLFRRRGDTTENLTVHLHPDGPAEVRGPAASRDARQLLFSMRRSAAEGHSIWLLDLETGEARRLTDGGGEVGARPEDRPPSHDRDPTFGPDGEVWFVSTRAGVLADQGLQVDADLYTVSPATGAVRRWTHTPHIERWPVFFDIGAEARGEVGFTALRDTIPEQIRAHVFRFPPSQKTEYHQHFGVTTVETFVADMQELPDGRYIGVVGDLPAPGAAGRLAVIDRNFGPEINSHAISAASALEMYRPPMVRLDGDGLYRDPAPLPDGRVLVAHRPEGPHSAWRIERLTLEESSEGDGPRVARVEQIIAAPETSVSEPTPLVRRAPLVLSEPALPVASDATALFRHHGLPMVDALLTNLAPSGEKRPREDIAFVRMIEHLPQTPATRRRLTPGESATTTGLGRGSPARILAELPVAPDGTFQARVPVGTPFRLQALDASHMAIGTPHNRWYYTLPGQVLTQGLSVAAGLDAYGSSCAACHGSADGIGGRPPEQQAPDLVTGASLTLSAYELQDPRRPLEPPTLGPETRIEVDFRRDVQPILTRRCARCHAVDGSTPPVLADAPGERFTLAYEQLLAPGPGSAGGRRYVDDGNGKARGSHLIEWLVGRELEAPAALPQPGGPHTPALEDDEFETLVRWIELGATFIGTSP